jgi:hypothetical protein
MGCRGLATVVLGGLFVLGVACGTFGGADDGPAGTDDGGSEATALIEASTSDGAQDAGASRWCDGVSAAFCADFDGIDVAEGWDGGAQITGGSVAFDPDASVSPPRSMRSTVFAAAANPHAAPLGMIFAGSPAVAHASFRILVPQTHPSTWAHLFALRSYARYPDGGTAQPVQFALGLSSGALVLKEVPLSPLVVDAGPIDHPITPKLDTGAWIKVDLTFRFGATGRMEVKLDDALVLTDPLRVSKELPVAIVVYLGVYADPAASDWVANYDNFEVDFPQ